VGLAGVSLLAGCPGAGRVPNSTHPSLGAQLKQQDDQLVGQRFRTLLDFETGADAVFIVTPGRHSLNPHTGGGAFESAPTQSADTALQVKIDSLLFGTKLPGNWTLLGTYVRPQSDTTLTTMLVADGQVVAQNQRNAYAGEWVFAAVELTDEAAAPKISGAAELRLAIESDGKPITIDDVLLVDNHKTLVERPGGMSPAWELKRCGFSVTLTSDRGATRAARIGGTLKDTWTIDEANPLRVRLHGAHRQTLYADGREITDGVMTAAPDEPARAAHTSPGDLTVDEANGRVDQSTDGDEQNDGYNEVQCAYQIITRTPRLTLQIAPHGAPVVSPVLEIKGLPEGKVSAMVEGRLIETIARLPDGTALVLLPLTLNRATTVTVKVE